MVISDQAIRDQTFMLAIGKLTVKQFFAGLYAHTNIEKNPPAEDKWEGIFLQNSLMKTESGWT